ncbi:MAG: 3-oxoacyl-ACP reductase family protein [Chloroflexota bacterium]|nr:3-oxoacyl-ACP reductase family protein [Chloroflexota bacterium]
MKLDGKAALVTGAGKGIGQAIALALAREGADVAVNAAHLSSAAGTAKAIEKLGRKAIPIEADVADVEQVEKMVSRVIDELGGIHILVNNAGVNLEIAPTIEQSVEKWDRIMAINLRGTYLCSREAGKWMVPHKTGKIVNIGSNFGLGGFPMRTAYSPSKAAVINLTQDLAVEWGKYNINVNCVAPGYVMTDLIKKFIEEGKFDVETLKKRTPLGRLATPEDVASAVVFLLSEEARHITGVTLTVDGGWAAYRYI